MRSRRGMLFAAVLAAAVPAGVAVAGKPSPPPPAPTGVVHFQTYEAGTYVSRTMSPDGSAKTALAPGVAGSFGGLAPSRSLHGGRRWFVAMRNIAGETYAGSSITRRELFAVRDDGTVVAQLTSDADLMCSAGPRWSPGDAMISWPAQRWSGGAAGASQIYIASVVFDGAGDVTGLESQPTTPAFTLADASRHDWSPDGARLVVGTAQGTPSGALWIVELATGAATPLPTSGSSSAGAYPAWSPDGSRIAFSGNDTYGGGGTISTVAPNGASLLVLATRKSKGTFNLNLALRFPEWSPAGGHVVYQRTEILGRNDVLRVAAAGGDSVNLTAELNTAAGGGGTPATPLGWR